jgi:hypothetical protein
VPLAQETLRSAYQKLADDAEALLAWQLPVTDDKAG